MTTKVTSDIETSESIVPYYMIRSYKRECLNSYNHQSRESVITLLGGKCIKCGISDMQLLNINHKNGGGTKERGNRGSSPLCRDILMGRRAISDLNLLCHNCNILYEYEVGRRKEDSILTILHNFVVNKLGGECTRCGNTDIHVLEINHKNGDGHKEFGNISPIDFYHSIINGSRTIEDLNVLCGNCNTIYRYRMQSIKTFTLSTLDELKWKFPVKNS